MAAGARASLSAWRRCRPPSGNDRNSSGRATATIAEGSDVPAGKQLITRYVIEIEDQEIGIVEPGRVERGGGDDDLGADLLGRAGHRHLAGAPARLQVEAAEQHVERGPLRAGAPRRDGPARWRSASFFERQSF